MELSLYTGGYAPPYYQALRPYLVEPLPESLTFIGPPSHASANVGQDLPSEFADVRKVRFSRAEG